MKGRPLAAITWTVRRPILGKLYFVAVLAALIAVELTVERRTKNLGLAVGATLATLLLLSLLFGLYVKLAGRRVTVTDAGLSVGREMLPYGRVEAILYTPADIAQANGYQILRIRHATGTSRSPRGGFGRPTSRTPCPAWSGRTRAPSWAQIRTRGSTTTRRSRFEAPCRVGGGAARPAAPGVDDEDVDAVADDRDGVDKHEPSSLTTNEHRPISSMRHAR
ncbi:MAG: hypothetical protein IPM79_10000 [Polyangiaceae bacterium]|nr:hypothetical protein [Polyangiaceae bacterium]